MFGYRNYLVFLFASLAISIGLQLLLPFPYGLAAALSIFVVFPLLLRRKQMRGRYGGPGGGAGGFFGPGRGSGGVKYVCLACRKKHGGGTCPRCGSKMQKVDF